jgi:hypothetical protein
MFRVRRFASRMAVNADCRIATRRFASTGLSHIDFAPSFFGGICPWTVNSTRIVSVIKSPLPLLSQARQLYRETSE